MLPQVPSPVTWIVCGAAAAPVAMASGDWAKKVMSGPLNVGLAQAIPKLPVQVPVTFLSPDAARANAAGAGLLDGAGEAEAALGLGTVDGPAKADAGALAGAVAVPALEQAATRAARARPAMTIGPDRRAHRRTHPEPDDGRLIGHHVGLALDGTIEGFRSLVRAVTIGS